MNLNTLTKVQKLQFFWIIFSMLIGVVLSAFVNVFGFCLLILSFAEYLNFSAKYGLSSKLNAKKRSLIMLLRIIGIVSFFFYIFHLSEINELLG